MTFVNLYSSNIGAPKHIKQILVDTKGEVDSSTVIVGDFNTPLTSVDRSSRQKVNKKTVALNDTLYQMDLINVFRAFHFQMAEFTFFSSAHGTYCRIDCVSRQKISLKFKKIEIISSMFSDHNGLKLEIITRKHLKNTQTYGG